MIFEQDDTHAHNYLLLFVKIGTGLMTVIVSEQGCNLLDPNYYLFIYLTSTVSLQLMQDAYAGLSEEEKKKQIDSFSRGTIYSLSIGRIRMNQHSLRHRQDRGNVFKRTTDTRSVFVQKKTYIYPSKSDGS